MAGTNKTNSAPRTEDTIRPILIPRIAESKRRPWIPAKLTITNETDAKRNVWDSFSSTKYPATIPNNAKMPKMNGFVFASANIPTSVARIAPARKAHAPNKFSRDLIGILFLFL